MQRLPEPLTGRGGMQPPPPRPMQMPRLHGTQMPRLPPRGLGPPMARGRGGPPQGLPFRGPGGMGPPGGGAVGPGDAYSTTPGVRPGMPVGGGPMKLCALPPFCTTAMNRFESSRCRVKRCGKLKR